MANQGRFQAKDADQGWNIYVMIVEDKERTEKIIEKKGETGGERWKKYAGDWREDSWQQLF